MINELQKQHVREVVEKILAQIDWPPEQLCEFAVRAALAVSTESIVGFREWAYDYLNGKLKPFNAINTDIQIILEEMNRDTSMARALLSAHNSIEAIKKMDKETSLGKLTFAADIQCALINAKLTAKLRGENLEISRIIEEMNIKKEEAC